MAGLGTDATNYVCVGLDFLCNMLLLLKTYRAHRQGNRDAIRTNAQVQLLHRQDTQLCKN